MPSSDSYQGQARGEQFVPNNVWATSTPAGAEEELTLPSGQTCRAKKMTVESMVSSGMVDQVDSLTAAVDAHTRKVKGGKGVPDGVYVDDGLMRDSKAMISIMRVVDSMVPHIVVSPVVFPHWTEQKVGKTVVRKDIAPADRVDGLIYTDMIDMADKMELFNWAVGGLNTFSSFRGEPAGDVGSVEPREGTRGKAKRRNRNR